MQRVWIRTKNTRESVKSRLLFKKRKILGVYNRKILNRWTVKYQNTLHILYTLKRSFISLVKNDEILSKWQKISPLKINTDKFLTSKGYISKQKNRKNTILNKKNQHQEKHWQPTTTPNIPVTFINLLQKTALTWNLSLTHLNKCIQKCISEYTSYTSYT